MANVGIEGRNSHVNARTHELVKPVPNLLLLAR
jgi:hypothetical protein